MPQSTIGASASKSISPTKKRKSTGTRLRFEIFKRDSFTCQYCGAQPPDVVLELDHVTAVSDGGGNDPLNLVTACESCNRGKADKPLGTRIIRPDADEMYLQAQQEAAEIRRSQEALAEKEAALVLYVEELQSLWMSWSGLDWGPSSKVIRQLLVRHESEIVEAAIKDVAVKVGGGYVQSYGDRWIKYLHAVARNMSEGDE